jgi:hypothetical protein
MSVLASMGWKSHSRTAAAMAHALPFPDSAEASYMRQRAIAFRDTLIVVAIQLVFRTALAMRRWNY